MDTTQPHGSIALSQQYVIQARSAPDRSVAPLGTRGQIAGDLGRFNTTSDGLDPDVLHGPGIRIDLPPSSGDDPAGDPNEPVTQMLLTVNEEEIGWLVIQKLAREFHWTIVDPTSGREWSP